MFIGRNPDGSIYGTWTCPQPKDANHPLMEEVPDTHPDVVAFLSRPLLLPGKSIEERVSALEQKMEPVKP